MTGWIYATGGVGLAVALGIAAYVWLLRPWHMRWGATDEEVHRPLPGDDLVEHAAAQATHAITIGAPASEVWPWLVQMGQGRGGFYSYDWLENLFGCDIHNAERIIPEYQQLELKDGIRLHPDAPPLSVVHLEPQRSLVIAGGVDLLPDMPKDPSFLKLHRYRAYTWSFFLDPVDEQTTRLIVRVRARWGRGLLDFARNRLFLEPAHSIMQEKMNRGIKWRVESASSPASSGE